MSNLHVWLLGYLLNSLWQLPLLFLAAHLASQLLHSSGSGAQHRVWVSALLLQSLLPAIAVSPAAWLRHLPLWHSASPHSGGAHVTVSLGPVSGLHVLHLPATLLSVAEILYPAVLAVTLARFLWLAYKLVRLRREALPLLLTASAIHCRRRCLQHFHLRGVQLATSSGIFSPVTIGLRHPLVLLPLGLADTLPATELETVLAHEFAHVARHDFLKNLLYELLALPVRYHPCLWLTRRHLVETREMVSDHLASEIAGPAPYAQSLLRLASLLLHGDAALNPHAIGILDANTFERRLMQLTQLHTQSHPQAHGVRRSLRVALCVALALGACGSALALRLNVATPNSNPPAPAPSPASPAKVPSGVVAGQLLTHVNPVYPEAAKSAKIQGTVLLHAIIGKDGTIENLQVVSGPKELRPSALEAVRQWVYKPYLLNGETTAVETTININYSLQP